MNGSVRYNGGLTADTSAGPSGALWDDCPWDQIQRDPNFGYGFFDDFCHNPLIPTETSQAAWKNYKVFNTGSGVVAPVSAINSTETGGGILGITLDTDNDSGTIADAYPAYYLSGSASTSGKLWFEARIAVHSIATNMVSVLLGLAETDLWTLATGVPLNGGDAITNSASFIGFQRAEDGLGVVNTVYSDRATSVTNIGASEGTAAANTWVKLGIVYDPTLSTDCVKFFQNGIQLATSLSRADLVAMTNLDANAVGLMLATVADTAGTSATTYMDWWRIAQLRP